MAKDYSENYGMNLYIMHKIFALLWVIRDIEEMSFDIYNDDNR